MSGDLKGRLLEGAQVVGEGSFRLDRRRAMEKLSQFQLEDPHRYVLELVAAAVRAGATGIDIVNDADDFQISWDGQHPSREEVELLFDFVFTDADEDRLRMLNHLAVGLHGAHGLRPRWILLERPGLTLDLTDPLEAGASENARTQGVQVHVRERFCLSVLREVVLPFDGTYEERLIRRLASRCPIPIRVNGVERVTGVRPGPPPGAVGTVGPHHGLWLTSDKRVGVDLVRDGIQVCTCLPGGGFLGVTGWMDAPDLTLNASRSMVLAECPGLERANQRILDEVGPLLVRAVGEKVEGALRTAFVFAGRYPDRAQVLSALPLLRDLSGRFHSLEEAGRWGRILVLEDADLLDPSFGEPVFARLDHTMDDAEAMGWWDGDPAYSTVLVRRLFPGLKVKDITEEMTQRAEGRKRRQELGTKVHPLEFGDQAVVERAVERDGFRGRVALPTQDTERETGIYVECRVDGLPVETVRLGGSFTARARLESAAFKTDMGFRKITQDATYAAMVRLAQEEVRHLLVEAATSHMAHPVVRRAVVGWVLDEIKSLKVRDPDAIIKALPPDLQGAHLARDLRGQHVALKDLVGRSTVPWIRANAPVPRVEEGVLELEPETIVLLQRIFRDRLVDATEGIQRRAEAARRRSLPRRSPVLTQALVAGTLPLRAPGLEGQVGVLDTPWIREGKDMQDCRVEVLHEGVSLGDLVLPLNLPGTVGIVEWADVVPNEAWNAPQNPEDAATALGEVVEPVILEGLLNLLTGGVARRVMLPAWLVGLLGRKDLKQEKLLSLEAFPTVGGRWVSLDQIQQALGVQPVGKKGKGRKSQPGRVGLRFVLGDVSVEGVTSFDEVLVLSHDRVAALEARFGKDVLEDVSGAVSRARANLDSFLARPLVHFGFRPGQALRETRFEGSGLRGWIGLAAAEDALPGIHVSFFHRDRLLCTSEQAFPVPLVALVEGEAIRPSEKLQALGLTVNRALLQRTLTEAGANLVASLADLFPTALQEAGNRSQVLPWHLACWLHKALVKDGIPGLPKYKADLLMGVLREEPLVPTVNGMSLTLSQVEELHREGRLKRVPVEADQAELPGGWVCVPSRVPVLELLAAVLPEPVPDATRELEELRAGQARRQALGQERLEPRGVFPASALAQEGTRQVWLGLVKGAPVLEVTWLVEGRPILVEARPFPVRVLARLTDPALEADTAFSRPVASTVTRNLEELLEQSLLGFFRDVARELAVDSAAPRRCVNEPAVCLELLLRLGASDLMKKSEWKGSFSGFPLLRLSDGGVADLDRIRAAAALGALRVVSPGPRRRPLDPNRPVFQILPAQEAGLRAFQTLERYDAALAEEEEARARAEAPAVRARPAVGSHVRLTLEVTGDGREGFVQVLSTGEAGVVPHLGWRRLDPPLSQGPLPMVGAVSDPALEPDKRFRYVEDGPGLRKLRDLLGLLSQQALERLLEAPDPEKDWHLWVAALLQAFPDLDAVKKSGGPLRRLALLPLVPVAPGTGGAASRLSALELARMPHPLSVLAPECEAPDDKVLAGEHRPFLSLSDADANALGRLFPMVLLTEDMRKARIRRSFLEGFRQSLRLPADRYLVNRELELEGHRTLLGLRADVDQAGFLLLDAMGLPAQEREIPQRGLVVAMAFEVEDASLVSTSKALFRTLEQVYGEMVKEVAPLVSTDGSLRRQVVGMLARALGERDPVSWPRLEGFTRPWIEAPLLEDQAGSRASLMDVVQSIRKAGGIAMGAAVEGRGRALVLADSACNRDFVKALLGATAVLDAATAQVKARAEEAEREARRRKSQEKKRRQVVDGHLGTLLTPLELLEEPHVRALERLTAFDARSEDLVHPVLAAWMLLDGVLVEEGNGAAAARVAQEAALLLAREAGAPPAPGAPQEPSPPA